MRLNEKQQFVMLVVVFAVAVLGEGLFAYSCLTKRSDLRSDLEKLEKEERDAKEKISQIPRLKKEAKELAQIIEDYAVILPTRAEVSLDAFLEDIEDFMRDTSLVMITGAPVEKRRVTKKKPKKGQAAPEVDNFDQHKYRFQLEGTYLDFVKFINRVENHTRFLEILQLKISPSGGETKSGGSEEIRLAENPRKSIEVVISTYTYTRPVPKQSKATETAKK